jgi:hypothetical protein
MAAASNEQVQQFVNERVRVRCEQLRHVYLACKDDQAQIDDVYANLTTSPTWTDARDDAPPHLMTSNDVLAYNAFMVAFVTFIEGNGEWPVIMDGCVRPVHIVSPGQ